MRTSLLIVVLTVVAAFTFFHSPASAGFETERAACGCTAMSAERADAAAVRVPPSCSKLAIILSGTDESTITEGHFSARWSPGEPRVPSAPGFGIEKPPKPA